MVDPDKRAEIIAKLAERGIDFDELAASTNQPEADPFDLLCHIAFNAPLRTRRERADRLKKEKKISSINTARGEGNPERAPGKICRAWNGPIPLARRSPGPSNLDSRQCHGNRAQIRRA